MPNMSRLNDATAASDDGIDVNVIMHDVEQGFSQESMLPCCIRSGEGTRGSLAGC